MTDDTSNLRAPSLLDALAPVLLLVTLLSFSVYLYGEDSSYGPNQIALVMAAIMAGVIGHKNGHSWTSIENGMLHGIQVAMGAILILMTVGMLIGTWILSGTVPAMLIYGLEIVSPEWFYPASCLVSAIVALAIGSSWSTAGTIGVGLMGICISLGLDPAITAGAIVSGAYMGDKMSPLSETTNLAPSVAGSELFDHIRHMTWTTLPAFALALVIFTFLGLSEDVTADTTQISVITDAIKAEFDINIFLLIPMLVLFMLARAKVPALVSILIGAIVGLIFALIFQQDAILKMAGDNNLSHGFALLKGIWTTTFDGYKATSDIAAVKDLLSKGGMSSMLVTTWLITCALAFGGIMESVGLLAKFVSYIVSRVETARGLILATLGAGFATNLIASDQYMAVVLPGRMFREEYERRGLHPLNLSRALEDTGTVTSVLIPWNTCGAYFTATLGVSTFAYAPYALFNIISPLIAVFLAVIAFKILPLGKTNKDKSVTEAAAEAVAE